MNRVDVITIVAFGLLGWLMFGSPVDAVVMMGCALAGVGTTKVMHLVADILFGPLPPDREGPRQ